MVKVIGYLLNGILGISIVAILLDASNQINGGIVLEYPINCRGVGITRVEDVELCRSDQGTKVVNWCGIQDMGVDFVVFAICSLYFWE